MTPAIIFIVILIAFFTIAIRLISKKLISKIDEYEQEKLEICNPYIQAQKFKQENDRLYLEYLDWLNKNGGDMPFEKYQFEHERKFNDTIDRLIN